MQLTDSTEAAQATLPAIQIVPYGAGVTIEINSTHFDTFGDCTREHATLRLSYAETEALRERLSALLTTVVLPFQRRRAA